MSNGCPQVEAWREVAGALNRLADVGEAAIEAFRPAAETVHGFGARLDALCSWLSGKWPWVALGSALLLSRTVNMAPEDVPKLVGAVADLAKALGGT